MTAVAMTWGDDRLGARWTADSVHRYARYIRRRFPAICDAEKFPTPPRDSARSYILTHPECFITMRDGVWIIDWNVVREWLRTVARLQRRGGMARQFRKQEAAR